VTVTVTVFKSLTVSLLSGYSDRLDSKLPVAGRQAETVSSKKPNTCSGQYQRQRQSRCSEELDLNLRVNQPSDSELEARVWLRDSRRLSWRAVMMSRSRGLLPCTFLTSSLPRRGHHLRILKKTCPSPKKPAHGVRRPRVTLDIEARVWQPDVSDDKSADNVLDVVQS
jgi:hypothetical protein